MKARTDNGQIQVYKSLPSEFTKEDGSVILNFRNANDETLKSAGFYDVVKPSFDKQTQTKGGLYFDADNEIVTYDVTDIDFNKEIDIIGEDGEPTGEKEKTAITIDDKEYFYEDLTQEQQTIVNHISDLQRKIQSSEFNLQQLSFGKDAFVEVLKKALEDITEQKQ